MNASARTESPTRRDRTGGNAVAGWRPLRLVERNALVCRRTWYVLVAGLFEPILYLVSIGLGVGALVAPVAVGGGREVPYEVFVAPGMLAVSAMNGVVFDTTFNFFVKYKYSKTFDAVLATPLEVADVAVGESAWALLRSAVYAAGFLLTMVALGLVQSWWAVLAVPAAVLIGFAFAGTGIAATTWMRSFVDFDYVILVIVPLFLFSATFFPLDRYPRALASVVQVTPLYQGVALQRALVLGDVGWDLLLHAGYLVAMGAAGVWVATRRLTLLLRR
ncbi:MAG TPA: ABC transporter permease [Acidimicrobiales bacterium]|nr:ABC transporter permease [Acidimicrobiales bacterium]